MLLRTMPWKHKGIIVILGICGAIISWYSFNSIGLAIKGAMITTVLLFASYFDYRFRLIPDWVHVLLLVIGLIDFNYSKAILGLVLSPLPFLIMALTQKGSIGGGDIKLIGSIGFVLGYYETSIATIIATILAVLFCSLYYFGKGNFRNQSFPFAPFIQIGLTIVMVIGGI